MTRPWILGLNASHNGAACLLHGDDVAVAIQEERLTRRKYERILGAQPALCIRYCLDYVGIRPRDLSAIAYVVQGHASTPQQDVRLNPALQAGLNGTPVHNVGHHLAHAWSAFATSGFREAAVLVVDGMGSPLYDLDADERSASGAPDDHWETVSTYDAGPAGWRCVDKHTVAGANWLVASPSGGMPSFGSLGGMYSAVSTLIFGNALDCGKVMGLAPFGDATIPCEAFYRRDPRGAFVFSDAVPQRFAGPSPWPENRKDSEDLSASVQRALEEALLALTRDLAAKTARRALCYAGGVALNSVANERIIRESGFERLHIIPAADDAGTALGAAYCALWRMTGIVPDRRLESDAFGRCYTSADVQKAVRCTPGVVARPLSGSLLDVVADSVARGKIVGWFDGGAEFGPRSLGQRSIVCDPRGIDVKDVLNARVKHREGFRPFAPAVLEEHADEWFEFGETPVDSKFMLRVLHVRAARAARVPGIVHIDGTARVQTVGPERPRLRALLEAFYRLTGVPILLNTSFNVMGEPIVETPVEALAALLETGLDACVFEDAVVERDVDVRAPLDVELMTMAKTFASGLELCEGAWAPASRVQCVTTGAYGTVHHTIDAAMLGILARCDGRTTGRTVFETLAPSVPDPDGEAEFLAKVRWLRRAGLIAYRRAEDQ